MIIKNKKFLKKKFVNKTFSDITFKYCNFWESNFKNANFYNIKIIDCIFCDSIFKNVTFNNCIIKGSNFSHSKFFNTKVKKSKLSNLNFKNSLKDNNSIIPNYISTIPKKNKVQKNEKKFNRLEKKILYSITKGKGFHVVKNYFTKQKIKKAFNVIDKTILKDKKIKKNLSKFARDKKFNQKYVYNILNKDKVFSELIQPKIAMRVFEKLLGQDFVCGFFGANCLLPGARGQVAHLDYPYLSFLKPGDKIPFLNSNNNFYLNCQILIPLTEFNASNGSTAILQNSHKLNLFPDEDTAKKYKFTQLNINPGSIVIFNGTTWHFAKPNYSDYKKRYCTLAQYLPKYILPMLDMKNTTKKNIYKKDKGILRKLLGIDLPYPSVRT